MSLSNSKSDLSARQMQEPSPCSKRGRADAPSSTDEAVVALSIESSMLPRSSASLMPLQPMAGGDLMSPPPAKGPGEVPASAVHGASPEATAGAIASIHEAITHSSSCSASSSSSSTLPTSDGRVNGSNGGSSARVPLLALEAIIGAGKSTLLDAIQEHFGSSVVIVHEPVGLWGDVDGHNLLSEYYKDQKRWAFSFQTFAIFSRLEAVRHALNHLVVPGVTRAVVMERSWLSDRECFAALLREECAMNGLEEAMHSKMFGWGMASGEWPIIDGFVYLDVEIQIAQSRVAKRGRCEESCIPSAYQAKLHDKHQAWMLGLEAKGGLKGHELGPLVEGRQSPTSVLAADFGISSSDESASASSSSSSLSDSAVGSTGSALKTPRGAKQYMQGQGGGRPVVASAPGVLRLDCSKENSVKAVGSWLEAIGLFIDALSQGQ